MTGKAVFEGYDIHTPGQQTVTVTYTENDITATATFSIHVSAAPTEALPPPTEPEETQSATETATEQIPPVPTKEITNGDKLPLWPLLIPLLFALILIFKVNEMVQRSRRKKRRPRKKMEWD